MNKRLTEANAELIISQCQRLEAEFAEQFTAVIQLEDGQEAILRQIHEIILGNSGHEHWLPTGEKL